jgi:hypothetical protein
VAQDEVFEGFYVAPQAIVIVLPEQGRTNQHQFHMLEREEQRALWVVQPNKCRKYGTKWRTTPPDVYEHARPIKSYIDVVTVALASAVAMFQQQEA